MKKKKICGIGAAILLIGVTIIPAIGAQNVEKTYTQDTITSNPTKIKTPIFKLLTRKNYRNTIRVTVVIRNPNPFLIWVSEMCFGKGTFDLKITTPSGKTIRSTYPPIHIAPTPRPIPAFGRYYHILNLKYYNFSNYKFDEEGKYTIKAEYRSIASDWFENTWRQNMKLWEKKYKVNKKIEDYTVRNDYVIDQNLVKYDCIASIAHAKMLQKINILTEDECTKIINKLKEIIKLDSKGLFKINKEDEDCHTAIENFLTKKLGEIGKKIHTGRSRNDQVLAALRLYYKDELQSIIQLVDLLIEAFEFLKEEYGEVEIPGYTHMKKAMPSSIGLWCDAFKESMEDNKILLNFVYKYIDKSPLGTGAGYGLPIEVDREFTSELMGFQELQKNPLYVQNSRGKFESLILHSLNDIMFDLNKMAMDIMLFSMSEFGFMDFPPEICTGSSIMPHKKNLDVLELIRANYHKNLGLEFEIKNIIGNLISGYNRDLQLTKKTTIKGLKSAKDSLEVMKLVIYKLKVNEEKCKKAMTKELYATEEMYNLIEKGITLRDVIKKFETILKQKIDYAEIRPKDNRMCGIKSFQCGTYVFLVKGGAS